MKRFHYYSAMVLFLVLIVCALLIITRDVRGQTTAGILSDVACVYGFGKASGVKTVTCKIAEDGKQRVVFLKTEIGDYFKREGLSGYVNADGEVSDAFGNKLVGQEVDGKLETISAGKDGLYGTDDDMGTVRRLTRR